MYEAGKVKVREQVYEAGKVKVPLRFVAHLWCKHVLHVAIYTTKFLYTLTCIQLYLLLYIRIRPCIIIDNFCEH